MPIFHRQILKELLINALITFSVITGIFIIAGSLSVLHKSNVLTLSVFLRFVYFFVGTNLDKILPMTVLVATVVSFGRLSADNELNAIRHCGISLYNVFAPGLLFGLLMSALVLYVNDKIAPAMELNSKAMIERSMSEMIDAAIDQNTGQIPISDKIKLLFDAADPATHEVQHLRLKFYGESTDDKPAAIKNEIVADRGKLSVDTVNSTLLLTLSGIESKSGNSAGTTFGSITNFSFPLPDDAINKKPRHQTLAELTAATSRKAYRGDPRGREVRGEYHRRISGSLACVLFALLGMPLAIIFRHGNRMVAFLIAFLIAIVVYYPTFILGELLSKSTDISPILAMWSGSIILLVLGGSLTTVVLRR